MTAPNILHEAFFASGCVFCNLFSVLFLFLSSAREPKAEVHSDPFWNIFGRHTLFGLPVTGAPMAPRVLANSRLHPISPWDGGPSGHAIQAQPLPKGCTKGNLAGRHRSYVAEQQQQPRKPT